MTTQIVNISGNQHHLKIDGKIAAYINCDNGAWYAQPACPSSLAPHYFELVGERVYIKRHEIDEEILLEKLGLA